MGSLTLYTSQVDHTENPDVWAKVQVDVYLNNDMGTWDNSARPGIVKKLSGPTGWKNNAETTGVVSYSFSHTISKSTSQWIGMKQFWIKRTGAKKTWENCFYAEFDSGSDYLGTPTGYGSVTIDPWTSYTVSYNVNGGSGKIDSQKKWHTETGNAWTITLSNGSEISRTGYTFLGWSTNSKATTATYCTGSDHTTNNTYSGNDDLKLYAIWQKNTYTITYNINTSQGESVPSGFNYTQTKIYGESIKLNELVPSKTVDNKAYSFTGWATSQDGVAEYQAGALFNVNADTNLYPIFKLEYISPRVSGFVSQRCNYSGVFDDAGNYITFSFDWNAGTISGQYHKTSLQVIKSVTGQADTILYGPTEFAAGVQGGNFSAAKSGGTIPFLAIDLGTSASIKIIVIDKDQELLDPDGNSYSPAKFVTQEYAYSLPKGGFPVDISPDGMAIRFFGIVSEGEQGFIIEDIKLDTDVNNNSDPLIMILKTLGWENLL